MVEKYIGVVNATGDRRHYEYAYKNFDGVTGLDRNLSRATQFNTEQEAIDAFNQSSIWVCKLEGEEITPLRPTR